MSTLTGHPLEARGWRFLALCVNVSRDHPLWTVDKVERRALAMLTCNVDNDDDLAQCLRRPRP